MLPFFAARGLLLKVGQEGTLEQFLPKVPLVEGLAQSLFIEGLKLTEGEFGWKKMETDWTAFDPTLQSFSGVAHHFVVVEGEIRHTVDGDPLHAVGLPFLCEEILLSDEGIKGHIDHPAHRMPKHTPEGLELFDDFGRHRENEKLLAKGETRPVDSSGDLLGTGDVTLDGPVSDPLDLLHRLAKSTRVRQSFVRHAFRYWMGRNEMPSDSQTLINADRAYEQSGGSFRALVISLLTSDSFLYRKPLSQQHTPAELPTGGPNLTSRP